MIDLDDKDIKFLPTYEKVNAVWNSLKLNYDYHIRRWQNYQKFISPNSLRYLDRSYSDKGGFNRDSRIINPIARNAENTFASGMMSLTTNKSNPWFEMELAKMLEYGKSSMEREAFAFIKDIQEELRRAFARTNFYKVMEPCYKNISSFGTMAQLKEYDRVLHTRFRHLAPGSYMFDTDFTGRPKHFQTALPMTVDQIMYRFFRDEDGVFEKEALPAQLKTNMETENRLKDEYYVVYSVFPNEMKRPNASGIAGSNYIGTYYLSTRTGVGGYKKDPSYGPSAMPDGKGMKKKIGYEALIRYEGHNRHPASISPWSSVQDDPYGNDHPGEIVINLVKQIQHAERRSGQGIDYQVMPAFIGSSGLKLDGRRADSLAPGSFTATRDRAALEFGLKPIHQTNFNIQHNELRTQRYVQIINTIYYVDALLKISMINKANVSATQINETSQERLMILNPVNNKMEDNIFEPAIQDMIENMYRNNALPEPPEELVEQDTGEMDFGVRYVSALSRALKSADVSRDKDYLLTIADLGDAYPEMKRKVRGVGFANDLAKNMGVNPKNILTDDEVEQMAQDDLERQAREQEVMEAQALAKADKDEAQALNALPAGGEAA